MTNKDKIPMLLNLLAYPGTGTLLAGKHWQGGTQISAATLGVAMAVYGMTAALEALSLQETGELPLNAAIAAAGGCLFAAVWVWAIADTWPKKKEPSP